MRLANRMDRLGTETAFLVLARARKLEAQGRSIVHLEIGEPDFDTPANVIQAGVKALSSGHTHYGPAAGVPELRQAIADDAGRRRGVSFDPDGVVVCPGAKPIMFYAILALINAGDEVIYPDPGFPIYQSMIGFVGAKPVPLPLLEERDFGFDLADLEKRINDKTRMLILNSPQNPTGGVLSTEILKGIADLAKRHDIIVLADEIYSRIVYDGTYRSIAEFPGMLDRTILLDGFSKTFAMTGWRLGYGLMPKPLAEAVAKLQINSVSCTASFTQQAGVEALLGPQDEIDSMIREFRDRRDLIVEGLNALPGVTCKTPKGAFYVFPNFKEFGIESSNLETYFLEEAGVACLSGTAFGDQGEGYVRFSYANSQENLREALNRLEKAITALHAAPQSKSVG